MTLDHIAAYGFNVPLILRYGSFLRTIGRIAAPLFLFLLVQSIRHTRSKPSFLLRLYIAGACTGLFDTAMNYLFGEKLGYFTPANILFTYFYVVLYSVTSEQFVFAYKSRKIRSVALALCVIIVSLLPSLFRNHIYDLIPTGTSIKFQFLFQGLIQSIIPSFYDVDYGTGFILLGVVMYFAKTKKWQCRVFTIFCAICLLVAFAASRNPAVYAYSFLGFSTAIFDLFQCRMLLALPFMLLYNGERGRKNTWLFYTYYPLHRQLLHVLFESIG